MPLTSSLYGMQNVEHAQDLHINVAPQPIPAPEDDPALPALNETTLEEVNVDEIGTPPATGAQEVSDDAAEQQVDSTSMYDMNTEETAALDDVGQLVTSTMSAFSEPLGDDTTILSSEVSSPQLTAYKQGGIGVRSVPQHPSASGRARGRTLATLLSATRAVGRALRRVFQRTKQANARRAGDSPATLEEPHICRETISDYDTLSSLTLYYVVYKIAY